MSTRCTLRDARDEATGQGFHLYEDLGDECDCVMLEIEGFTFETSVSFAPSDDRHDSNFPVPACPRDGVALRRARRRTLP